MTQDTPRPGRIAGGVGLGLVCASTALYAAHPLDSVDLFWHLKLGEVIAHTGRIPTTDLFSAVAPDAHYVQFNWLWDVLAFALVDVAGLGALRLAQTLLMTATLAGLYLWCWRRTGQPALAFLLSTFMLLLVEDRFQARPDALTSAFVVMLLPAWTGGLRRSSARRLLGLCGLAALWSNVHGGASLLLLAGTGALTVGAWLEPPGDGARAARRATTAALGVSVVGLLSSPTLLAGLGDWGRAIGPQLAEGNQEWLPTYTMLQHGGGASRYLIAVAPTLVTVLYGLEQRVRLRGGAASARALCGEWLLCAGLLVLAHQAVRNAWLCVVPLVFMALRRAQLGASARQQRLSALLGLALLGLSFEDAIVDSYGGIDELTTLLALDVHPDEQPLGLGGFVAEAGIEGGVLNDGRWGGYLIYRGWPALHVFADSRHHLGPEALPVFRASYDPLQRDAVAERAFRRWGLELTAFANPTFAAGVPPGWVLLFKSGPEELYQRIGGAHWRLNLQRARAWLARRGQPVSDASPAALEAALRARGGADWLAAPRQQQRMRRAQALLRSELPAERAEAESRLALLSFQADQPDAALQHLARQAALAPADPRPALYAALIHVQAGAVPLARAELERLKRTDVARLSALQRQRLAGVLKQLSRSP